MVSTQRTEKELYSKQPRVCGLIFSEDFALYLQVSMLNGAPHPDVNTLVVTVDVTSNLPQSTSVCKLYYVPLCNVLVTLPKREQLLPSSLAELANTLTIVPKLLL